MNRADYCPDITLTALSGAPLVDLTFGREALTVDAGVVPEIARKEFGFNASDKFEFIVSKEIEYRKSIINIKS